MTWARALLTIAAVSIAAAALVGLVSRVPAEVRGRQADPSATDPELGSSFTDEQVSRHAAYQRPGYVSFAAGLVVQVVTLVVLARGPWAKLIEGLEDRIGAWPLRALVAGALAGLVLTAIALPLAFVRGYTIEHAWGLSTQDVGGWLADRAKGAVIGAVTSAVAALVFFAVVRWQPRTWWVFGWAAFTGLTAVMFFLWPVVIAPLFNKFTPLEPGPLDDRVRALAEEAGVPVDEVLVADASRRTTAENAYVAGLGKTKRLVVYDTLLKANDDDRTAFVVAHELGHQAKSHVPKNLAIASAGLLAAFAFLGWLGGRGSFWGWAGADGPGDPRALPLLVLLSIGLTLVSTPLESALSRRDETEADRFAIELTGDPDAAVAAFRRLALANLAYLDPPPLAVAAFYSHPPIPDRIDAVLATAGKHH
ncbi:MAG TPA: M48 family metallopeptidase [Actinomycetota bacterium]|nr:M48 family metallopeptidase [Actinomycetota bacterium]